MTWDWTQVSRAIGKHSTLLKKIFDLNKRPWIICLLNPPVTDMMGDKVNI